jgi:hypothetical protein
VCGMCDAYSLSDNIFCFSICGFRLQLQSIKHTKSRFSAIAQNLHRYIRNDNNVSQHNIRAGLLVGPQRLTHFVLNNIKYVAGSE